MTQRYSVFLGDVAQDEYYAAPYFPVSGDKVIVEALPVQFGGSIANSASIYAHYGMPTSFIAKLNPGALTQRLVAQLREQGIDTDHVIYDESVPDSHCIVLLSGDQHIVIIPTLGITEIELTPQAFDHLAGAEFIVTTLTDAKPLRMDGVGAAEVLRRLRAQGTKIVVDLDVYNPENQGTGLLELCDIVFMNALGAQRLAESGESISGLLAGGALAVIVTLDADGCEVHTADGVHRVPGIPVEVVDVTGAGDTFTSSFLYAYSTGGDPAAAAEFAGAAATLSVTRVGARGGLTTRAAVDEFRQRRNAMV